MNLSTIIEESWENSSKVLDGHIVKEQHGITSLVDLDYETTSKAIGIIGEAKGVEEIKWIRVYFQSIRGPGI